MVSLIVVGGGSGRRMKSRTPKIFLSLRGKPLLLRTLEAFRGIREIRERILVLPKSRLPEAIRRYGRSFAQMGVSKIGSGGPSRRDSVSNGLSLVDRKAKYILVHDAARPLVTAREVQAVLRGARKSGAAVLGYPVRDTIKEVSTAGKVVRTPDRSRLWHTLTPQAFQASLLRKAHAKISKSAGTTDDAQLVERMGRRVVMVAGSHRNIKITTPEDLKIAQIFFGAKSPKSLRGG